MFQRFHRSRRALETQTPGLGLGLYIARQLVEAHGGRIWAESVPNQITSIHFVLPIVDDEAAHADNECV
jgi:signal transduction histidine kinase